MSEAPLTETKEILAILRRMEGVAFAGQAAVETDPKAGCWCEDCGCHNRHGNNCGCDSKCTCHGKTAHSREHLLDDLLGAATLLQAEDIATLREIRERLVQAYAKSEPK